MDKVVHFEIPADDQGRAKKFYQDTFGWKTQDMPEFEYTTLGTVEIDEEQMPKEPGAINGGMSKRQADMPNPQIFIQVDDIDAALANVRANGGQVVREKTPVGEMGAVANFKDTEGNVVGLWQNAQG